MIKLNYNIILFSLTLNYGFSQSVPISGRVLNEQKEPLEFVSVALLKHKDSTIVNYTITDIKGGFKIHEVPLEELLIQFSYMGFITQLESITYTGKSIDLNTITLTEDLNELEAVTISAVVPIQIKKDTIAFNASSFKVNPSDNLEELLKKLPGLEIDSNGKVIAQGNEITKIYVDGKEFFGGDPSIVLKNLSADAISKIEVIDKRSDEAEITGVDDGNKQMVINFTLKKSKKRQGFGKLSTGMGLDSRYFSNLNYNRFLSKTQFSVIGKFNNINITGSNIQSFLENSDGIADESDEDESASNSTKNLSGFLKTVISGVHIGHEFKENQSFNADYFYNLSDNRGVSNSKRISFANNNNFDFESEDIYDNISNKHNLNFNYINKSNKTYGLTVKGHLISDEIVSNSNRYGFYTTEEDVITTTNNQNLENISVKQSANFNINFYKKLEKKGRSFSVGFNSDIRELTRNNNQNTVIKRNINKINPTLREFSTLRDEAFKTGLYNFDFKYTEPLGNKHYFKLQSFLKSNNENEKIYQLRKTVTSASTEELLAFNYKHIENSYQTRFAHSYNTSKINTFAGFEFQDLNRSYGKENIKALVRSQFHVNPIAFVQYKPKNGVIYKLNYKKVIRNPKSSESSTVINDLNPFFIRRGNPDLHPEKRDDYLFIANIFDYKSSLNFSSRIQYQFTQDAIVQNIEIDEDFIKTRTYQNSGVKQRLSSFINFSKKIKGLGLRYAIKNTNLYNTSNSIINLQLNDVFSRDYLVGLSLENSNKNFVDLKFGANYSINETSFSLEKDLNRTYTKQEYFSMFDYDVSEKLNVNTQFDYIIFSDNQFSSNLELPIWNAAFSYNFSKLKSNTLKLVLIDLLNENVDVYRRSTTNFFEETTSESLGSYIILSYTYRLSSNNRNKNNQKS